MKSDDTSPGLARVIAGTVIILLVSALVVWSSLTGRGGRIVPEPLRNWIHDSLASSQRLETLVRVYENGARELWMQVNEIRNKADALAVSENQDVASVALVAKLREKADTYSNSAAWMSRRAAEMRNKVKARQQSTP